MLSIYLLLKHCIYPKRTLHESSVCTSPKLVLQRLKKLRCSKGSSLQVLPSQVTWLKRRRRKLDTVAEGHPRWLPEGSSHVGGSAIGKGKRRRKLHASHNRLCMGLSSSLRRVPRVIFSDAFPKPLAVFRRPETDDVRVTNIQMADKDIHVLDLDNEDSLDTNLIAQIQSQVEKRTQLGAMTILCLVAYGFHMLSTIRCTSSNIREFVSQKERRRQELMSYIIHTEQCRDIIRMGPMAFINLCERLRATGLVKDAFRSTVEEQVAKFLHIVGHNVKNRTVSFFFHRSGETVSRHFHNVLNAIIMLEGEFLVQPSGIDVQPYIQNNSRFYPYFKDCLGAIDGTHVQVKVPTSDAPRFRGRKDWPTQNVFAACDFDMKFTYVLGGWEGTTSDSRILKDALSRQDPLIIPQGKYYLGDAGFMLKRQILTPYRGVRYHLKEYSRRGPHNHRELFNHRHSSLRNVIERTFGVLKKRFPIIASGTEPHYSLNTMTNIILACCILHNFLRGFDNDDSLLAEVDRELMEEEVDTMSTQVREEDYREGSNLRDSIANEMWRDYQNN
ncbi:hypothetical protein Fmac_028892 [Flemingia macrophylla]|uniref:Transposase n=1 Tax=Flemingia macrophylla TaxID=520843 RepID=A0ABD1L992_9FABA